MLAAVDAGCDAIDAAMDSLSGLTSQPCLGSLVAALDQGERATGLDLDAIQRISLYWEAVRFQYRAFESDLKAGASEVYLHEMPGGQFTNLKEQARSLGLEARWHEVARAYAEANRLFGDIVKVTPSSKVVGDMALMMVTQELSAADVLDPARDIAFPEFVVQMMRGELGMPPGGFPEAIQKKALKGAAPIAVRPGSLLPAADLDAERDAAAAKIGRRPDDRDLASSLMYPKVFADFSAAQESYGPTEVLPTPNYFYGLPAGRGSVGRAGTRQDPRHPLPGDRRSRRRGRGAGLLRAERPAAHRPRSRPRPRRRGEGPPPEGRRGGCEPCRRSDAGCHFRRIGVPGQSVRAGDVLLSIEAMKMETALHADRDGTVEEVLVKAGDQIDAKDLLLRFS